MGLGSRAIPVHDPSRPIYPTNAPSFLSYVNTRKRPPAEMSPLSPPQKVYPGKQHISNEPSRCTLSLLSPYSLHNRGPGLSVSNLLILPHTHVMQPPPSITNATPPKITELPGHARRRRRRCYSCRGRRRRRC